MPPKSTKKGEYIMKKTLIALGILTTLLIGAQTSFAACPCENPCPCPVATPCPCPATPVVCPCQQNCEASCVKNNSGKCKCRWYKIFEDKCCCDKPTNCKCGVTARRCHWYKFWEDKCVIKNSVKCDCDDNCGCNKCGCDKCCD